MAGKPPGMVRTFDYGEARSLRASGLTFVAIGELLGVTAEAVRYACRGAQINTTSTSVATKERRRRQAAGDADRVSLRRFAELTAHDPPLPSDGSCAVCGNPRRPERSVNYAKGCAEIDAFCSSTCARSFHGTTLPERDTHGRPAGIPICGTYTAYRRGCKCFDCLAASAEQQRRKRQRIREARVAQQSLQGEAA